MAKADVIQHRASLCGHVRDAVTGAGVPEARVELLRRNLSARTRADGLYFFLDLRGGAYDLRVSAPQAGGRYGTAAVDDVRVALDASGRPLLDPR
ncbi:MAG TPA: carboxypeptidase-like regulatory domain-containing protein, partial [Albitalea sp.]